MTRLKHLLWASLLLLILEPRGGGGGGDFGWMVAFHTQGMYTLRNAILSIHKRLGTITCKKDIRYMYT